MKKISKKQIIIGVVLLAVFGLIWKFLGLNAGLLWLLFFSFAAYSFDNRIIGIMAILCLSSCPVLLSYKLDLWAEKMAVYAFFFFVMTVVLQLIEYKRHPELYKENEIK